jgi:hypothetical protein
MAPSTEKALYVGEAGNCLADGTPLISGETVCEVPKAEAEGSELWSPVAKNTKVDSPSERNAPPAPVEDAA